MVGRNFPLTRTRGPLLFAFRRTHNISDVLVVFSQKHDSERQNKNDSCRIGKVRLQAFDRLSETGCRLDKRQSPIRGPRSRTVGGVLLPCQTLEQSSFRYRVCGKAWRSIAVIAKMGRKRRNGRIYHDLKLLYRFTALRAILEVLRKRFLLVRGQLA